MRSYKSLQCSVIFLMLYFVNLGYYAQSTLDLYEGNICLKGKSTSSDHICRKMENCPVALQGIRKNIKHQLCSFNEKNTSNPIVCCPPKDEVDITTPTTKTINSTPRVKTYYTAAEKCHEYSELIFTYKKDSVLDDRDTKHKNCTDVKTFTVGGKDAEPMEFPHMALIGYHREADVDDKKWLSCGSLISNRWILTAAHAFSERELPRWARLGDLNHEQLNDNTIHEDYRIIERIAHPNYRRPLQYNDIALFRLERDVNFSPFIRPICLHTEKILPTPLIGIATGWGITELGEPPSTHLHKVALNVVSEKPCGDNYNMHKTALPNGIDDETMICANATEVGKDTCRGDGGGPIQIKHPNSSYQCMYVQIGITSFGPSRCFIEDKPSVYTRVSTYIPWIEQIVWPKNE